ncbi:MAG: sugar phosphate isomerase/epimerase family protein [Pseudomonadota bacterium]
MRDFSGDLSALALNTATLGHNLDGHGAGWPPEAVIDACAARGFGGIVFWQREGAGAGAAKQIGARVRAAGMTVAGLCRTPYLVGPGAPENLDAARRTLALAADLGAPVVTIVSGGTAPGTKGLLDSQKRLAERIATLAEHAAAANIRLAIEPLNPMFGGNRTVVMTVRDALRVADATGAANVGVAVDVYHVWWDTTLAESLRAAKGRIFGYHLCDWLSETRDMLLDRGMMGDGVADLKAIRSAVEATGYDGFCEVEIFSAQHWWQEDPARVLDTIVDRFRTVC